MDTKKETAFGISQSLETKEVYESPAMEIVEAQVEQGFQMSGASSTKSTYDPLKEQIF